MHNEDSGKYSPSGTLRGFLGRVRKIDALVTLMSTNGPRLLRKGGGGVASREELGPWEEESQGRSPVHAGAGGGAGGPGLCWQCPSPPPWGFRSPGELLAGYWGCRDPPSHTLGACLEYQSHPGH